MYILLPIFILQSIGVTVAQCVALLPHSKKVVGSSPAWCNMPGLAPGACSRGLLPGLAPGACSRGLLPGLAPGACSRGLLPGLAPGVCMFSPGSPHNNKNMQKEQMPFGPVTVPDQDRTGHLDFRSPGATLLAAHCSWHSLGEDARMGKMQKINSTACVCCVSPLTLCVD